MFQSVKRITESIKVKLLNSQTTDSLHVPNQCECQGPLNSQTATCPFLATLSGTVKLVLALPASFSMLRGFGDGPSRPTGGDRSQLGGDRIWPSRGSKGRKRDIKKCLVTSSFSKVIDEVTADFDSTRLPLFNEL